VVPGLESEVSEGWVESVIGVRYLDGAVQDSGVGRGAGVGDEGVDFAKVLDDVLDELFTAVVLVGLKLVRLCLDSTEVVVSSVVQAKVAAALRTFTPYVSASSFAFFSPPSGREA